MKFLTRQKVGPLATEETFNAAQKEYCEYLSRISSEMTTDLLKLSKEITFHDGRIILVEEKNATNLSVDYLLGDLQQGYFRLTVMYIKGSKFWFNRDKFEPIVLSRRTEILCSELIQRTPGEWSHNLLFDPNGSIEILFADLSVKVTPIKERAIKYFGDPFILLTAR